jgi:uncharacterized protein YkwD
MPTQRHGWIAKLSLATILSALFAQALSYPLPTVIVAGVVTALVVTWALDIVLSVVASYRNGIRGSRSIGEMLRYHADRRTPPLAALSTYAFVIVAAVVVISVITGSGIAAVDTATPSVGGNVSANELMPNVTASSDDEINETKIEQVVHQRINEERTERGLNRLAYSEEVAGSAEEHSQWMATELKLNHSNIETQYRCDTVGENIAYTYASQDIDTESGTVNHYDNETRIARGLVRQWMNSPPHRENILRPGFTTEGIGVATNWSDDGQRVYATQALCG